jgi:murein L,D-transpeptidase YcbB/YkuD
MASIHCPHIGFPVLLSLFFCLSACREAAKESVSKPQPPTVNSQPDSSIRGNFSDQHTLHFDSARLNAFFREFPRMKDFEPDIRKFYTYRNFRFAWYDQKGLIEQADHLVNQLTHIQREGIQTEIPYKDSLDKLFNEPLPEKAPDANIEILLTAGYFFYAEKVWNGLSEKRTTNLEWFLPRERLDLPRLMDSLLRDSAASLFTNNYNFRQYDLLKKELQLYRHLDSAGPWNPIAAGTRVFKKNDSSAILQNVRRRLFLLGDLAKDSQSGQFDNALEQAVKHFQYRYGLDSDGVMGAGFFRDLNIAPQENIRKIIVNMERMRWVPANLSNHYLIINIPAFTLYDYEGDTLSFKMNVVVGKDIHKTVIFNGDIKYVVFSPYWNVPASIMKKEIMPAIRKDPNYLRRNHMEWNGNMIRQKPGPFNSLGQVKFLFPNSYSIYLHDSPAKSLFHVSSRAFSHGCIRVAEPKKLASRLLRNDANWNDEKITAAMNRGREQYVTLKETVPVFIAYLTAWVDNQGNLNFRKDIYNRDRKLEEMIR